MDGSPRRCSRLAAPLHRAQRLQVRQRGAGRREPLKIIGVLDWEMAALGDPLIIWELLAYWVEKNDPDNLQMIRMMPTNIEGRSRATSSWRYAEEVRVPGAVSTTITASALQPCGHRPADLLPLLPQADEGRTLRDAHLRGEDPRGDGAEGDRVLAVRISSFVYFAPASETPAIQRMARREAIYPAMCNLRKQV